VLRLSHVLIRVDDLAAAVDDYRNRGFTVAWGSDPAHAHNALIWFEEGPFLELLLPPEAGRALPADVAPPAAERFGAWRDHPPGVCDYALETDDERLDGVVSDLRAAGVACTEPGEFGRTLPDGTRVSWWLSFPHDLDLPFVMSAYQPPQRPPVVTHANGARAVGRVEVHVDDPTAHRAMLEALLGPDIRRIDVRVRTDDRRGVVDAEILRP
jgi:catechol 2,3-dioxygenase-like lactoylglutathione lyase family enzyme